MGKEIRIYCRMNASKRLIFFKWMQAIRTCGYSILSCGKSSNSNFEVLCITRLLWVIKYIVLIIAFKNFFEKSWLEWWGDMYCFFTVQFQSEYVVEKQKRVHFNLQSFFCSTFCGKITFLHFLSGNYGIFRRLIPTVLYFWKTLR